MVKCFFLLFHFLVVEAYELPKSASHVLNVPLNIPYLQANPYQFQNIHRIIFNSTIIKQLS